VRARIDPTRDRFERNDATTTDDRPTDRDDARFFSSPAPVSSTTVGRAVTPRARTTARVPRPARNHTGGVNDRVDGDSTSHDSPCVVPSRLARVLDGDRRRRTTTRARLARLPRSARRSSSLGTAFARASWAVSRVFATNAGTARTFGHPPIARRRGRRSRARERDVEARRPWNRARGARA